MKTKTESILTTMNVLTWIVFIGLLIHTGAIIVSYFISIINPEGAKNLYLGLDLFSLRQANFWKYSITVLLTITILGLKAYSAYLVIQILSKINLEHPFTMSVALLIEKVSHIIFTIWAVSMLANANHEWLRQSGLPISENWISGEFIFLAGVIFIIAQIFKKGIELQSENELTI
ncbi:MAG TPA: DUF2975 domain-containing protein [Flavobacterium sp.]|uniref:DUF2975 domain-containing protein n=1 Tax=Flavobacterium sp. TaxID=239 RepID=UPI002DB5DF1F|nr:DUF2975 domain-containing protein [Flavobacterium sp.]HEU4790949.1 DUF2975 domain-containing protein [Flavobacterium sp.]